MKNTSDSADIQKNIIYITGSYPRATDTFIQREVSGLRGLGWKVLPYAVRLPGNEHINIQAVSEERQRTTYLLPFQFWSLLGLNIALVFRKPVRYLQTLKLAFITRRSGLKGLAFQLAYFLEATLLASDILKKNVTHVHNHLGDASATVAMLAGKLANVGFSMTIHGPHIFFDPGNWALREKVALSKFIVCISDFCKSQVMLFSDSSDWQKLCVVHCGVNVDEYSWRPPRQTGNTILYVGRLAAEKGIMVLFDSFIDLLKQMPHAKLRLAGDGEDRNKLQTRVLELGLSDHVTFLGYCSQELVRKELESSDLFVLPSFAEGVPVSLMEAMAIGTPVVSTFVGGVAELVVPDDTGILVAAGNSEQLTQGMLKALTDTSLRKRLSSAARNKVEEDFELRTQLTQLSALFEGRPRSTKI